MNLKIKVYIEALKALTDSDIKTKEYYEKEILPLLVQAEILGFPEFIRKLRKTFLLLPSNEKYFAVTMPLLRNFEAYAKLTPTSKRFMEIVEHSWDRNKEAADYVHKVVQPLFNTYNKVPMREFNQQLESVLKKLAQFKHPPKSAIAALNNHIKMQNHELAKKLKIENEALHAKQAMLNKPLKLDGTKGAETFDAFISILKDARDMRQILERRAQTVKGKELTSNHEHLLRWRYIENIMTGYLKKNKHGFVNSPAKELRKMQKFMLEKMVPAVAEKEGVLKTDFAYFQKFIGNRVDAILKAEHMRVTTFVDFDHKIDFNKFNQDLQKSRPHFIHHFKRLGMAPNDYTVMALDKLLGAYHKQLHSFYADYNHLQKQKMTPNVADNLFRLERKLLSYETLVKNIYGAFEKNNTQKNAMEDLYMVLMSYSERATNIQKSDPLFGMVDKMLTHLNMTSSSNQSVFDQIYDKVQVNYGVLKTDEARAKEAELPKTNDQNQPSKLKTPQYIQGPVLNRYSSMFKVSEPAPSTPTNPPKPLKQKKNLLNRFLGKSHQEEVKSPEPVYGKISDVPKPGNKKNK